MTRLAAALALFAAGCAPTASNHPATPPLPTTCGSQDLLFLIGKTRTDAISAQLKRMSGAESVRWISPGMAVTMDYRAERLNVHVDKKGMITKFTCG